MKRDFNDIYSGKKVLIWGYGMEGRSTENFLRTHTQPAEIAIYEGDYDEERFSGYDVVFKSPGIPYLETFPGLTSQTDLFLQVFRDQTVGITGTKGKSTVSGMTYEALKAAGKKTVLAGNIGVPCLDMFDAVDDDTIVVFELSCHQLMNITVAPHISLITNLYEEHLDYYGTREKYFDAKRNIYRKQKIDDILIVGPDAPVRDMTHGTTIVYIHSSQFKGEMKLLGEHNRLNAAAARTICAILNANLGKVNESLSEFTGLEHRLETAGEFGGHKWYDDSISTINESVIAAVQAVPDLGTLIIGGMDRGIDYSPLVSFLNSWPKELNVICAYETGERIFPELKGHCTRVPDLEHAVETASEITPEGLSVVMSPGAASYTHFKNFAERGDVFKRLVRERYAG
ncbi:MAG: UDP-N-acetylmuramoyl-L-alanine--D-glutamate ligase [Lachnospiraceae bacterium]|nr:UDP-N-acetylmuramoyl-L-alanine--D-glutamate ligase [Lachnospiraceae bacterium]